MRYNKLTETFGIDLVDFDVAKPCSAETQAELRTLFREHHFILIRGGPPCEADQDRFTEYFTAADLPQVHPAMAG